MLYCVRVELVYFSNISSRVDPIANAPRFDEIILYMYLFIIHGLMSIYLR